MRSDKFKAYKLRMAGRSYSEISRLLKAPKSTLSAWFSTLEIPPEAQERINKRVAERSFNALLKRNRGQTLLAQTRAQLSKDTGLKEIDTLSKRDLLIIGASLYWAEGYKRPIVRNGVPITSHRVSLTNADPDLICMFLRFLREICLVPENKIFIWVRYFEHQDPAYLLSFWQKKCNIPYSNFKKTLQTVSISSQRKRSYNSLPFGVAQISVSDTGLYHRIMGMIKGLSKTN